MLVIGQYTSFCVRSFLDGCTWIGPFSCASDSKWLKKYIQRKMIWVQDSEELVMTEFKIVRFYCIKRCTLQILVLFVLESTFTLWRSRTCMYTIEPLAKSKIFEHLIFWLRNHWQLEWSENTLIKQTTKSISIYISTLRLQMGLLTWQHWLICPLQHHLLFLR